MPAPFDFPGHYWDEAKGKFFKIESSGTAPAGARWSREEVSHQRQRERIAESSGRGRRRGQGQRAERGKSRGRGAERPVKRAKTAGSLRSGAGDAAADAAGLSDDDDDDDNDAPAPGDGLTVLPSRACTRLLSGLPFLGRETNDLRTPAGASASSGRYFEPSLRASAAIAHARSLQYKGAVPVLDEDFSLSLESFRGIGELDIRPGPFTAALGQPRVLSGTRISCMYVQPDPGPPGLGIVYTSYDTQRRSSIKGQYIMTDEHEFVSGRWPRRQPVCNYSQYERSRPEELDIGRPTTINYHEGSRMMVVTSTAKSSTAPMMRVFSPHMDGSDFYESDNGVTWYLGMTTRSDGPGVVFDAHDIGARSIYACVPSPSGFQSLCAVGTENGITVVDLEAGRPAGYLAGAPPPGFNKNLTALRVPIPSRISHWNQAGLVSSLDFVNKHPALIVAGGRFATPWLVDLRKDTTTPRFPYRDKTGPTAVWHPFRPFTPDNGDSLDGAGRLSHRDTTGSTAVWHPYRPFTPYNGNSLDGAGRSRAAGDIWNAAHVRSVNEHHVVVAGLRNTMMLYDLRYLRTMSEQVNPRIRFSRHRMPVTSRTTLGDRHAPPAAEPLLRFSSYYNTDRMTGLGFAVDTQLGIVAAAEEHAAYTGLGGGVGLFSLATGERLATPSLDTMLFHSTETLSRVYPSSIISHPTITTTTAPHTDRRPASAGTIPLPRIPALSFAELPGEASPSLFAAVGAKVHKFSARKLCEDVIDDDEDRPARTHLRTTSDRGYDMAALEDEEF